MSAMADLAADLDYQVDRVVRDIEALTTDDRVTRIDALEHVASKLSALANATRLEMCDTAYAEAYGDEDPDRTRDLSGELL